ncbi:MAG: alpha/beta hydrolase, partial [Chloroflexi bacterium]|nr:alpha/beta hydrolase [Chloroflexota bacterium]
RPPRRRWPRVLLATVVVALAVVVLGAAWWLQPQPLLPEATAALASTPTVDYRDEGDWLRFVPTAGAARTALVFYPGGKVEAAAYAPAAQAIAGQGFAVFVAEMPLNLAVLAPDRADAIIQANPGIERWALAGHSLGGAMATSFIAGHPGAVRGLALWAAYPNADLSGVPLAALSIWGTLDAGAERMGGDQARAELPPGSAFVSIAGGNHEQMGWYTGQPNDPPARISREDQQAQVVEATLELLRGVDAAP